MRHWRASCAFNALMLGDPCQPFCARVYLWPDCIARRGFLHLTDWWFGERDHCRRMHDIAALGRLLREDARLNAIADERADGPFVTVTLANL